MSSYRKKLIAARSGRIIAAVIFIALLAAVAVAGVSLRTEQSAQAAVATDSRGGKYEKSGGWLELQIVNTAPAYIDVDASSLAGNDTDSFSPAYANKNKWESKSIGKGQGAINLSVGYGTINVMNFIHLAYENIESGYIPIAVLAEERDFADFLQASAPDFRQWLWTYTQKMSEISTTKNDYVADYIGQSGWMKDNATGLYTGQSFTVLSQYESTLRKYTEGSTKKLNPLFLVVGAIPIEEGAVSISYSVGDAIKLGNNFTYQNNWNLGVTVTNNASYPMTLSVDLMEDKLTFENPEVESDEPYMGFSMTAAGFETVFVLPGKSVKLNFPISTSYHIYNTYYNLHNRVLNADSYVNAVVEVDNITHAYGASTAGQYLTEINARTFYPGNPESISDENLDKEKQKAIGGVSKPTSITPGEIKIPQVHLASEFSTQVITIKGTNLNKVKRLALVLVAPGGGMLNKYLNGDYLKVGSSNYHNDLYALKTLKQKTYIFTKNNNQEALPAENSGNVTHSAFRFKKITSSEIQIEINKNHLPQKVLEYIARDTLNGMVTGPTPYFNVYLLHEDEQTANASYFSLTEDRVRKADFSIDIKAMLNGNSGTVSLTDVGKISGNYLAIVHSSLSSGKPTSSKLKITSTMNASEQYYAPLRIVGGTPQKESDGSFSITAPCKINNYLEVRPQSGVQNAKIYMKTSGNGQSNIEIWSKGCQLYAGSTRVMYDFTSVLTGTDKTWYHSNYFTEKIYSDNGMATAAANLTKIKLVPSSSQNAVACDYFVVAGGITHVYPYVTDAGIGINARVFDLIPQFLLDCGLDKYLALGMQIDEFRVPYTDFSMMPTVAFAKPLEFTLGGDFYLFKAGLSVYFDINMLPETKNPYISLSGSVNLFNKFQAAAELLFVLYEDEVIPDVIYFTAGSDLIGLVPPAPIIELSRIGGGIYDLGKTFGKDGWNYVPPVNLQLDVDAEINLYAIGLGINGARLTVGPSILEVSADEIVIKKLKILENLSMGMSWDMSPGVNVSGSFNLSMPVITYQMKGGVNIEVEGTPLKDFLKGSGELSVTVRCDRLLQILLNELKGSNKSNIISRLQNWDGKDNMALTEILMDALDILRKDIASFMGVIELKGSLQGKIKVPEVVPVVGGYTIAAGSASVYLIDSILCVHATGKVPVLGIEGSFTFYYDAVSNTYAFNKFPPGYVASNMSASRNLAFSYGLELDDEGGAAAPMLLSLQSTVNSFEVEGGSDVLILELIASEKTAVTLSAPSFSDISISADAMTELSNGWVALEDNSYKYTYVFNGAAAHGGEGTTWTITGGITSFSVTKYDTPVVEGIDGISFDDVALTGEFTLIDAVADEEYTAELALVSASGTAEVILRDLPVSTAGATSFAIDESLLLRFPSGAYTVLLTVMKTGEGIVAAESVGAFTHTNTLEPEVSLSVSVSYEGNGSSRLEVSVDSGEPPIGYEITLLTEEGNRIEYIDSQNNTTYPFEGMLCLAGDYVLLQVSTVLPAGIYNVIITPYVNVGANGEFRLYGSETDTTLTLSAANPAIATLADGHGFSSVGGDSYIIVASPIVFDADDVAVPQLKAVSFETTALEGTFIISYTFPDAETVTETLSASELAAYAVDIPLVDGQYVVEISSTNGNDTFSAVFVFNVDGIPPQLNISGDSLLFDGTTLTVSGYVEPGSQIVSIGEKSAAEISIVYELDDGVPTGKFSFSGDTGVVGTERNYDLGNGETETRYFYTIDIKAVDAVGNLTVLSLTFIVDADADLADIYLSLETTVGRKVLLDMSGVALDARLISITFLTELPLDNESITYSSSDESVLTVNSDGTLTLLKAGTASVTASYMTYTATIEIEVADEQLALPISVASTSSKYIEFSLEELPHFVGEIIVSQKINGIFVEVMRISDGFSSPQFFQVDGLTPETGFDFLFEPSGGLYLAANAYAVTAECTHSLAATAAKAETCTEDGNTAYWYCENCDKYFSDEAAETEITLASTVIDKLGHTESDWIVDTIATETTDGSKHKECTVCKEVLDTATIPATGPGHVHSYGTDWTSNDTKHWHECEGCGGRTDEAAHTEGSWIVDTAETCTADGSKHKECTVCGYVLETEAIPAAGHTVTAVAAKDATCTEAGNTAYWHCEKCGKYFSDAQGTTEISPSETVIASTGHTFDDGVVTPPTYTADGFTTYTCTKCGHSYAANTVPKLLYSVTVNEGEGVGSSFLSDYVLGEELKSPTREGYTFEGWYTDAAMTKKVTSLTAADLTASGTVTLYAKWSKESSGLSGGAIAGIVIGGVAALGIAGFCIYWFGIRKKKRA